MSHRSFWRAPRALAIPTGLLCTALAAVPVAGEFPGDVHLWDLAGGRVAAAELLAPEVPTVVLFWSLYQPDSRQALRAVDLLAAERDLGAAAICIEIPEYREGPDAIAAFLERAGVKIPAFVDPGGEVLGVVSEVAGGGRQLPATYVARPDGTLELVASRWIERYAERVRTHLAGIGGEAKGR